MAFEWVDTKLYKQIRFNKKDKLYVWKYQAYDNRLEVRKIESVKVYDVPCWDGVIRDQFFIYEEKLDSCSIILIDSVHTNKEIPTVYLLEENEEKATRLISDFLNNKIVNLEELTSFYKRIKKFIWLSGIGGKK